MQLRVFCGYFERLGAAANNTTIRPLAGIEPEALRFHAVQRSNQLSYRVQLTRINHKFSVQGDTWFGISTVCPAIYVAARRTRSTTNNGRKLVVKKCRTTTYQNSYFMRVTKLWNILPNDLTLENQTLSYFKKSLYSYYNKALKDIYDIDDNRTWKSVCIKCKNARLLNEVPHCCF